MGYAYLWEFIVEPEQVSEFERHYGPQGSWAQLFRKSPGYIETILLRDSTDASRFVTIDRWENAEANRAFRTSFAQQYADLDRHCENLTVRERELGSFDEQSG